MDIKTLVKKIIYALPKAEKIIPRNRGGTGGTNSARYCYSVWLRYLTIISDNGLAFPFESIAELGPGDSLGIGLAAVLSGVKKYFAFDAVKYAYTERNLRIFDDLVKLYRAEEDIPDSTEFPRVKPYLESYRFPKHILADEYLKNTLKEERLKYIRKALLNLDSAISDEIQLRYFAPWDNPNVIKEEVIDMVYSQAVMEHVDDLDFTYKALYRWLKPNGIMLHQIDFKSHDTAKEWNGHWKYSDSEWQSIRKNKSYLINREPYSTHVDCMRENGFKIIFEKKVKNASELKDTIGIQRKDLSLRFKDMSDDDLSTSGVCILAVKSNHLPNKIRKGELDGTR